MNLAELRLEICRITYKPQHSPQEAVGSAEILEKYILDGTQLDAPSMDEPEEKATEAPPEDKPKPTKTRRSRRKSVDNSSLMD